MANLAEIYERLLHHAPGEVSKDEPLAPRTSVRVGGTADLFFKPRDANALVAALKIFADADVPWLVLGGGANTIVGDGGVRGVVIKLPADAGPIEQLEKSADANVAVIVTLGAGKPIAKLLDVQRRYKAVGAEYLAGVPGTLGGAVAMNAGTRHGWVQSVLTHVTVCSAEGVKRLPAEQLGFSYRHTTLPAGSLVWDATFRLPHGDVQQSEQKIAEDLAYRRATQPLNLPNSGSVFMNPPNGSAGRLIQEAGLKGYREGNAQISELHANFIVNRGGAKASEITSLMARAQREVFMRTGIELTPEVKVIGEL
jgi:UDP-N-acetylmuramate dehydrogenase